MNSFFRLFWKICLLQRGPQDVPAHNLFLLSLLLMLLGTAAVIGSLYDKTVPFTQVEFFNAVITATLVGLFLALRNHLARFSQTMVAIFGIGILFNLMQLGLTLIEKLDFIPGFLLVQIGLLMIIWQITVIGHILRHAMEIHIAFAILIAILFLLVNIAIINYLSPVAS